jgi:hypothetical protein
MPELREKCSCGAEFYVKGSSSTVSFRYAEFIKAHLICRTSNADAMIILANIEEKESKMSLYTRDEVCKNCLLSVWHGCVGCYDKDPKFCHCEEGHEASVDCIKGECEEKQWQQ